jgi:hypothetical protein
MESASTGPVPTDGECQHMASASTGPVPAHGECQHMASASTWQEQRRHGKCHHTHRMARAREVSSLPLPEPTATEVQRNSCRDREHTHMHVTTVQWHMWWVAPMRCQRVALEVETCATSSGNTTVASSLAQTTEVRALALAFLHSFTHSRTHTSKLDHHQHHPPTHTHTPTPQRRG